MLEKILQTNPLEIDKYDVLENIYNLGFNLDFLNIIQSDNTLTLYEFDGDNDIIDGLYDHIENKIYIKRKNGGNIFTLLHELLHYLMFTSTEIQRVTDILFCKTILEKFKTKENLIQELRLYKKTGQINKEDVSFLNTIFFLFDSLNETQVENILRLVKSDIKIRECVVKRFPKKYLDIIDLYKQESICYFISELFENNINLTLLSPLELELFQYFSE